jgi:hypothetical protein
MKTPMQILKTLLDNDVTISHTHINNLLEKEKQMIIDAFCEGNNSGLLHNVPMYAKKYYNETFKE